MTDASRRILLDRSRSYLMDVLRDVERRLTTPDITDRSFRTAAEVGTTAFREVNSLLKAAIDREDIKTFSAVDDEWHEIFGDIWIPDLSDGSSPVDEDTPGSTATIQRLVAYRSILCLGLAMWVSRRIELGRAGDPAAGVQMLKILSGHLGDIERLLGMYTDALETDNDGPSVPWTNWFLEELPERQAHFIPTRQELLFTVLLLAAQRCLENAPVSLEPREWFVSGESEIDAQLVRLTRSGSPWPELLGGATGELMTTAAPPPRQEDLREERLSKWLEAVETLRSLIDAARQARQDEDRIRLRETPADPERIERFRDQVLSRLKVERPVRDLLALHGAVRELEGPPPDREPLVNRLWMPKTFFTPDSRIVGLEMVAGDLGRATAKAEFDEFLKGLDVDGAARSQHDPAVALPEQVRATTHHMTTLGLVPSLLVVPFGWELRRELGLDPSQRARELGHDLIPGRHYRHFEGIFDGLPVLRIHGGPSDVVLVVDVSRAVLFDEWPSEEQSGVEFELREFDSVNSLTFVREHPEVRDASQTVDEAADVLREKLLLTLRLCWRIKPGVREATQAIEIPPALRRET